jgi:hypothetical protein
MPLRSLIGCERYVKWEWCYKGATNYGRRTAEPKVKQDHEGNKCEARLRPFFDRSAVSQPAMLPLPPAWMSTASRTMHSPQPMVRITESTSLNGDMAQRAAEKVPS